MWKSNSPLEMEKRQIFWKMWINLDEEYIENILEK